MMNKYKFRHRKIIPLFFARHRFYKDWWKYKYGISFSLAEVVYDYD